MDWRLEKRLECTKKDKDDCLRTLDYVLQLIEKAKKFGIVSLEEDIEYETDLFNRQAIMMIVDNLDNDIIRHALETRIISSGLRGKELLKRLLVTEGLLLLQKGYSRRIIREVLFSYFGEEFIEPLTDKYNCSYEKMAARVDKHFEDMKNRKPMSIATAILEEPVQKLTNHELIDVLKGIDKQVLILALKGTSGECEKQILLKKSFSARVWYIDELRALGRVSIEKITEAQNIVLDEINKVMNGE